MAGLITNCTSFYGDICDEIRLFFLEKQIAPAQEAGEGLFIRAFLDESVVLWRAECAVLLDGQVMHAFTDIKESARGSALYVKKLKKRFIKNAVYTLLKEYTGEKPPWGSLTGIRPAKLARELLTEMGSDAKAFFQSEFDTDADKTDLVFNVAEKQIPLIQDIQVNDLDIYAGVPFCVSRCSYCSFGSYQFDNKRLTEAYMDAILREIAGAEKIAQGRHIRCLYVGGGTPTALSASNLRRLLHALCKAFPDWLEFTVEAGRPDTIDSEKLDEIRRAGATRICVNAQTTNPATLQRIGRKYAPEEFSRAFNLSRKTGFTCINTDIIMGLPGETIEDVIKTLSDVCAFGPENITVHTLAIKNAAAMTLSDSGSFANPKVVAEMVDFSRTFLRERGYIPYYIYRQKYMTGNLENVGYAKPGNFCLYNVDIMEELADNMSFGPGAMSKRISEDRKRIERACNVRDIKLYVERLDEMLQRKFTLFG